LTRARSRRDDSIRRYTCHNGGSNLVLSSPRYQEHCVDGELSTPTQLLGSIHRRSASRQRHANSETPPKGMPTPTRAPLVVDERRDDPKIVEPTVREVPWWTTMSAGAAPILLIGGFSIAAALQPSSYSPVRDTISALAARGAADPWVMTLALVGVGICYVLTAIGLRSAHRFGRISLAGGGVATLLVATFQQPPRGYSLCHAVAVAALCAMMCAWPVLAARRKHRARLLTLPASSAATAITFGLVLWFALELHGHDLGLAERCAAVAAAAWLFPVAVTARRACDTSGENLGEECTSVTASSSSGASPQNDVVHLTR
jgi:hypothetical membrane protein